MFRAPPQSSHTQFLHAFTVHGRAILLCVLNLKPVSTEFPGNHYMLTHVKLYIFYMHGNLQDVSTEFLSFWGIITPC